MVSLTGGNDSTGGDGGDSSAVGPPSIGLGSGVCDGVCALGFPSGVLLSCQIGN